ncbi:hypothetical protein PZ897_14470 [Hoeflea sp. YIM 152468]|uniref:hypothetical protein n=1 Tax=Hoeflea sp. YIM 152468 TaxID=3031759 RepID=UPI0023DC766A|nr:hypothetical protein [Hoeflea sp. YIM 152468]MDF1609386.1 hypothetical protein [Hoeflea sp. YIM 152468]
MQRLDKKNVDESGERPLPEPDTAHERNKAAPECADLADPAEIWKDGETTPTGRPRRTSGGSRVADAGDMGGATPSPYSEETQADIVSRQTGKPASGN